MGKDRVLFRLAFCRHMAAWFFVVDQNYITAGNTITRKRKSLLYQNVTIGISTVAVVFFILKIFSLIARSP
ncbi:hypothetical protein CRP01_30540 [Flavilitoribacter nigricans DSM 23189 = NBRC 102662]|uniref:Uncharacterized protein n=1 Tax=Flavilitoribacter nigricans (strain ATCC 23147 / DSM 23189 / NBRC 102662 / NCIMB 1420 / SS-2) TaxID=1122177 RepID=A0A2D0N2J0_FLAN2|nr:hypothetical protein CRP01_30540 [Flavilitoribacter nigricans DSM 23189 = NBRC 102662]